MKNNSLLRVSVLFIILISSFAFAQEYQISGYILDGSTNQPLAFANIEVVNEATGTSSNINGLYELQLKSGSYELQVSYLGYKTETVAISVSNTNQSLSIRLVSTGVLLQEVNVYTNTNTVSEDAQVSIVSMQSERVREISSVIPDVMRSIQALPGIASNNEFSAQFNVRGGNQDENLVLVNGAQVYEPFHFKYADNASVGIFNVDLIHKVNLITGGFSARYGDRASSVLDIKYREGNREKLTGSTTLSMTNLEGYIEAPLGSKSSFIFGLRKSYLEYILNLLDIEEGVEPSFYDAQGVISYYFSPRNKLLFEFIYADDDFNYVPDIDNRGPFIETGNYLGEPATRTEITSEDDNETNRYYSSLLNLKSVNFLSNKILMNTAISYYDQFEEERESELFRRNIDIQTSQNYFYKLESDWQQRNDLRIETFEIKSDIDAQIHPFHQITSGVSYQNIRYNYERFEQAIIKERSFLDLTQDSTETTRVQNFVNPADAKISTDSYKLAAYVEDVWQISDNFLVNIGGRIDYFDINKDLNFSPRLNASYNGLGEWTIRGAWGHYFQSPIYRQIASPAASDTNTQAIKATHYIISLERAFPIDVKGNNFQLKIDGYLKNYDDLIHSVVRNDGQISYTRKNDAEGVTKGFDLHATLNYNRFYGWISYGLLSAREDILADEKGDFPRYTDQRHSLSFVGDLRLGKNWKMNLRGFYGSGFAYTPFLINSSTNQWEEGEPNSEYLPAYRRVDLRISKAFSIAKTRMTAFLDVSNLLNFKNIFGFNYRYSQNGQPFREEVELWPIVPSLGMSMKW